MVPEYGALQIRSRRLNPEPHGQRQVHLRVGAVPGGRLQAGGVSVAGVPFCAIGGVARIGAGRLRPDEAATLAQAGGEAEQHPVPGPGQAPRT